MPNSAKPSQPTNFAITLFVIVAMFGAGVLIGNSNRAQDTNPLPADLNYELIRNIYNTIEKEYIEEIPSGDQLTEGIIKGLIAGLEDTYSAYLNPEEARAYLNASGSQFEGIGVQLGFNGEYTVIESVFESSPAAGAGVKAQDLIVEVDGKPVAGERPEIVATKVRGKAGSIVTITLYRPETQQTSTVNITRQQIDIDNIDYQKLDNGVVVINIRKFTEKENGTQTGVQVFNRQWDAVVNEVVKLNPEGIVVNLRGNPGGYVESVKYVAEEFLKDDQVIMREFDRANGEKTFKDGRRGKFEDVSMTVLVDEGSASASEIFAAAIQDNNRGEIIGQPTVGKGVEQKLIPLTDGSILMLVFRHWLTPNGLQIKPESPIKPTVEVEYKEAANGAKYDTQLTKAIELL